MAGDMNGISQIAPLLQQAMSPDLGVRRAAEEALAKLESSPNYGVSMLSLTNLGDMSLDCRLSAAIAFKNYIKRNWPYDARDENSDQVDRIGEQQRDAIKQHITKIMLESQDHIQRQLSEAISIIGKSDFPEKWPSLILELEHAMNQNIAQNYHRVQGVLLTGHSIFRRYRHELASNKLWSEIKIVVQHFAQPLTDRFKELVAATSIVSQDVANARLVFHSLLLITEIYNSLITQDLPEYFEDHINDWLPNFLELLKIQQKIPDSSYIEDMKAEICETASMFLERFSDADDFKGFTERFAESIWNLLVTTNQDIQYDAVVSSAIRFLVTVARRPESRPIFQGDNVLNLLCEKVIIPNLTLRETDEELFEDDPDEYVNRDIEGSDVDTRRRAACDLVQVLSRFLEADMIKTFENYIARMLEMYNANRVVNWKFKDTAIFVYTAMAMRSSTRQHGAVSISQLVNIEKFLVDNIADDFNNDSNQTGAQILKADALRYITNFRNHIPIQVLVAYLPAIVRHINNDSVVVRTYASITLERLLTMRDPTQPKTTAFKSDQFEPYLGQLVDTLFRALYMPNSEQNEHIMCAIMRLFSFSKPEVLVQFLPSVMEKITSKLAVVSKNPTKPYFNHYLFETLALTIRAACFQTNYQNEMEENLFSIFEHVRSQDVQEFVHYVLQLLNLLLRNREATSTSAKFLLFFDESVLSMTLWEKSANTRPLAELLHTYIIKFGTTLNANNKLGAVLSIFQKLMESKATDHEALDLLRTMILHVPPADMDVWMREILITIFTKLQNSKTSKLVKQVVMTFSLFAFIRGPDVLEASVNQFSGDIFARVIGLFISGAKSATGFHETRLCKIGMIKILSHPPFIQNNKDLWLSLLIVLMEMFELPQGTIPEDQDHFAEVAESLDFQAQYSKLIYASIKKPDPTHTIGDLKSFLATCLANLSSKMPGLVPGALQSGVNPAVVNCLMSYCQAANVTIS